VFVKRPGVVPAQQRWSCVVALVAVCIAVVGVAIAMLNDVCNELDRRRRNEEIAAAARRQLRQRAS
jgi:nitrate reductase cytochrome c-type subunit